MKKVKELRGEFSAVLKKAYIQKESVDNVKDKKFTDPTGYEFLESWTWSWFEKQLKAQEKEVLERVEKEVRKSFSDIWDSSLLGSEAFIFLQDVLSSLKK